jgi:hypothetical protein
MCRSCMAGKSGGMIPLCKCRCGKTDTLIDAGIFYCRACRHRLMSA